LEGHFTDFAQDYGIIFIKIMTTPLILGGQGNLGCQLQKVFPNSLVWDKDDIDATDFVLLREKITAIKSDISLVINCIAYNDVDKAESNPDIASLLNSELPKKLAEITRDLNLPLIHFSTGYIFSGSKNDYEESDQPDPISVYGKSKAEGEKLVLNTNPQSYIIRTNALFGPKGSSGNAKKSMVDAMLEIGVQNKTLKGVADEYNSFTYTKDLAEKTFELVSSKLPFGIYHIINSGSGSWYDLAVEIFKIKNIDINIIKIPGTDYPRPAKRPAHAILKNTKLSQLRPWQEALREYLSS
jgi:dTDP-4-dehydrorhamnose reductase